MGLRLRSVTDEHLPKALVPVLGRPFVDWKLSNLAAAGATRAVLLIGHHGNLIREHVGDGRRFGIDVQYVDDGPSLLGTGGALLGALPSLPETFWVTYGDTLLDVDLERASAEFANTGRPVLMTVLHNRDRWEPSNARVADGEVVAYGKDPRPDGAEHLDYGMLAFDRGAWSGRTFGERFDLGDIVSEHVAARAVTAFEVRERFHDIGTPEALLETEDYVRQHVATT